MPRTISTAGFVDPNAGYVDPNAGYYDPYAGMEGAPTTGFDNYLNDFNAAMGSMGTGSASSNAITGLEDYKLPNMDLSQFQTGDFAMPDFGDMGSFDMSKFDTGSFDMSKFDTGSFDMSKFEIPEFDMSIFENSSTNFNANDFMSKFDWGLLPKGMPMDTMIMPSSLDYSAFSGSGGIESGAVTPRMSNTFMVNSLFGAKSAWPGSILNNPFSRGGNTFIFASGNINIGGSSGASMGGSTG